VPGVNRAVHALLVVAAALAGATAGVLGSFVHALEVGWVPVGLLVGLALSGSVVMSCRLLAGRSAAVAAALGWLVAVLVLSGQRPEGDLVVANTAAGQVWLFAGTALVGACIALPLGRLVAVPPSGSRGDGR
jgi:Family of unknown function (DUF6113)